MRPLGPLATPPTAEICGKFLVVVKVLASEGGREVTMMFLLERETMQETSSLLFTIQPHQLTFHPRNSVREALRPRVNFEDGLRWWQRGRRLRRRPYDKDGDECPD